KGVRVRLLLEFTYPRLNASVGSQQILIPITIRTPVSNSRCEGSSISKVVCIGSSAVADSLIDVCQDLDPCVDFPVLLVAFSFGALADSGSFPSLRLLDPRSDPAKGSSSLSASSSRCLFSVTVSLYVSKMILSDSYDRNVWRNWWPIIR
nr:hypothetical protein [Tanacetum cinerariifolium]